MQFIAVRHARTEYNEKELINGQIDEDLSIDGRTQIPALIDELAGHTFTKVYSSTMKRAVETATPIADHFHLSLTTGPGIIEVGFGSFEGKDWHSTEQAFGASSGELLSGCDYDLTAFGGESAAQTRARVEAFLEELKKYPQEIPLVVTHGGILRWLYYLCNGEKVGRMSNLSIHTFELK